jgi:hypothetical protein
VRDLANFRNSFAFSDEGSPLLSSKAIEITSKSVVRILPSDAILEFSQPYSFVVLEKGPRENIAFCEALRSNFQPAISFAEPLVGGNPFEDLFWADVRQSDVLQNYSKDADNAELSCDHLVENFDSERAHILAQNFNLIGTSGPWLISVSPVDGTSVLLNFSCYRAQDFPAAVANWRKNLVDAWIIWARNMTRDRAMVNVFMNFTKEYDQRCLVMHFGGR